MAAGRWSGRAGAWYGKQPYFNGRRALQRCAGAWYGKQPYFAGRRTPQRARRCLVWETALLCGLTGAAAVRRRQVWETALHCGAPDAAAGMPVSGVGNSPTLRARRCPVWETALLCGRAGARYGKQPYFAGRRALQRVRRRQVWETALLCRSPGAAAGAPAPGVGNSPTLRAAGRRSGCVGARCGKQPYFVGRRALQRVRRRQVWETALLCRPPGAAAGAPATDVGNSPTLQAAKRHSGRAGDRCGKQPYFAGRRPPQRVRR